MIADLIEYNKHRSEIRLITKNVMSVYSIKQAYTDNLIHKLKHADYLVDNKIIKSSDIISYNDKKYNMYENVYYRFNIMSKNDCKDTTTQQDGRITPAKAAAVDSLIDARVIEDIPVELANNLTLLSRKLTAFLAYYSAASLTRLNTLNRFIQDAENKLYNINVDQLDLKELNTRYREAKRAQAEIMTIARQVSQQACDTDNTARIDEVYSLLKSMSNETLTQLQTILLEKDDDNDSDNDA